MHVGLCGEEHRLVGRAGQVPRSQPHRDVLGMGTVQFANYGPSRPETEAASVSQTCLRCAGEKLAPVKPVAACRCSVRQESPEGVPPGYPEQGCGCWKLVRQGPPPTGT